ncbi:MAG: fibronectin type III domain-containing protein [Planctomycetota bacterium]
MKIPRLFPVVLVAMLSIAASAQNAPKVQLAAATATVAGKTEVRIQVRFEEGWAPPEGFRIYRELGGSRVEVFRSKQVDDGAVEQALGDSAKGLWSSAKTALQKPARLDFAPTRPPSSLQRFREMKSATQSVIELRPRAASDASARSALQSSLQRLQSARLPALAPGVAVKPNLQLPAAAAPSPDAKVLKDRSRLTLASLVDRATAEKLGFAATDSGLKVGDEPTYTMVAIANNKDGANLATLRFKVGADPMPPAPANIESTQFLLDTGDPTGSFGVRWDRLDPKLEAQLLNASYQIEVQRVAANAAPGAIAKPQLPAGGLSTPGKALDPKAGSGTDASGSGPRWRAATRKPLMISTLEGNKEPESFFTSAVETPGTHRFRIALVDGFGRRSAWTEFDVSLVEWRTPDSPAEVEARLDETARDKSGAVMRGPAGPASADQMRALGMRLPKQPIGLGRGDAKPRDLSKLVSALSAGGKPSVTVTWLEVAQPAGLTARYRIFRIDADAPTPDLKLLTPQPIEGVVVPPSEEEQAAAADWRAIDARVRSTDVSKLRTAEERSSAENLRIRRDALADVVRQRLSFIDTAVVPDSRYRYVVRAVFTQSGFESGDVETTVVGVPTIDRPAAVAEVRFVSFQTSDSVARGQLLEESAVQGTGGSSEVVAFAVARQGKLRLAPVPGGFKRVAAAPVRPPSIVRPLRGPILRPKISSPGAVSGEPVEPEPSPQDAVRLRDIPLSPLVPRVPTFDNEVIKRLNLNLFRARDDGGAVRIEWIPVPGLRDVTYKIRRKVNDGKDSFVEVGMTRPNARDFTDAVPRTLAREYVYEVTPISRWGVLGRVGKTSTVVARVPSTVRPTQPNLLRASPDLAVARAIKVLVAPNPPEESVVVYRLLRDGSMVEEKRVAAGSPEEIEFVDDRNLDASRTQPYQYTVVALTEAGLVSAVSRALSAKAERLESASPTALRASTGPTGVTLNWTAASGASGYLVRRTGPGATTAVILASNVVGTTFLDTMAYAGSSYTYQVLARSPTGAVSLPAEVPVTMPQ